MKNELATLARNIRVRRAELNITQEELAFEAGLHRTYITQIERGYRNLTISSLLVIARALRLTVSELTREIDNYNLNDRGIQKLVMRNRPAPRVHSSTRRVPSLQAL